MISESDAHGKGGQVDLPTLDDQVAAGLGEPLVALKDVVPVADIDGSIHVEVAHRRAGVPLAGGKRVDPLGVDPRIAGRLVDKIAPEPTEVVVEAEGVRR